MILGLQQKVGEIKSAEVTRLFFIQYFRCVGWTFIWLRKNPSGIMDNRERFEIDFRWANKINHQHSRVLSLDDNNAFGQFL